MNYWCDVLPVMFFSSGSQISEVPRPIAAILCHMIEIWLQSPDEVQKFWVSSLKILGAKNMQNFGYFCNVRFYPRNGLRYPDQKGKFSRSIPPRVIGNRKGELWSTSYKDLDVRLDPLKCTFLGYYISALRVAAR